MSNNIAISFEHVSKMYQLGVVGTGTISNDLKRWWAMSVRGKEDPFLKIGQTNDRATKGSSDFVYALRDIDFKVEQGDVVGIIGKNGAGKSTLLKLLSRITAPTSGCIKANGRIASLLEVGTGFHPELTGRENIYMNGTIMGMKRHEIDAKLDEIVDFAGVERYLDTPTKRYSSGMTVRLGFAVAAFLEPEILVVDEVLAVGDAEFQKKAIGKMQDVANGQGRTVLFVSHNMDSVRRLCKNGVVLKNGMVEMMGTADECVDQYLESNMEKNDGCVESMIREPGVSGKARATNIMILNPNTNEEVVAFCGRPITIRLFFDVNSQEVLKNCALSIGVTDNRGMSMTSFPTELKYDLFDLEPGKHYADLFIPKLPLTAGSYRLSLYISENGRCADWLNAKIPFEVLDDDFYQLGGRSIAPHLRGRTVLCEHDWSIDNNIL